MDEKTRQHTEYYISARNQHPAWVLLASRRAPLVLSCLQTLFERSHDGIPLEEAIQSLTNILVEHVSQEQYEVNLENPSLQASRELREWIRRRLIVERDGRILATDALEVAITFIESLNNRFMTSTASRLSTVQREIENLETRLNPNPANRVSTLRRRIAELERELQEAEAGHIEVLETHQAVEHIREVFNLSSSLRADFRRVEDSWREADRMLRQSIIGEQYHRGDIVERLLNDQDALLNTPEGRVFDSFQQQLRQSAELTAMSERLRVILRHPSASNALNRMQRHDLRWLVKRLVDESQTVLQARARSERDVRGFMKTGLAAEHHRIGHLLNEFLGLALKLDWQRQMIRKKEVPLPAVGVAVTGIPAIERLRFKEVDDDTEPVLDLSNHAADLTQIGDDFWEAFNGLDREVLIQQTLQVLAKEKRSVGLAELAALLPPIHDLETFAIWIGMAREAGNNRLHVRLLEVKLPHSPARFFDDGFTRKLLWKEHPWREAVKALLAESDRHCVDSPERLRDTPRAMTVQGLMSGKQRFYDKQDQKRLDDDWLTGFDNRDRLNFLAKEIAVLQGQVKTASQELEFVKGEVSQLQSREGVFHKIQQIEYDSIDVPGARRQLEQLRERLNNLTSPDSDASVAKANLKEAQMVESEIDKQLKVASKITIRLDADLKSAQAAERKAQQIAQEGIQDEYRELCASYFPTMTLEQLADIQDLERQRVREIQQEIDGINGVLHRLNLELTKRMSEAKRVDTGALVEVGADLDDIPAYLQRLQELTEEALPEKLNRFLDYLNRSSDDGVTQLLSHIEHEVLMIEERLNELNETMFRVDFQPGRYLRLDTKKVIHESLRTLEKAQRQLNAARFVDDNGESHYRALQVLVAQLQDACERNRTLGAKALLDPRFRLEFAVSVMDRQSGNVIESRTGSQGGSGGEKEIIASYVLTASLSYALCPAGSRYPLFGTIILDEAFSRSSHAVAGRIIAALREFGLHAVFITPNKEMRLLRDHTRSAVVVHRRGQDSNMASLSWEELEQHYQRRENA